MSKIWLTEYSAIQECGGMVKMGGRRIYAASYEEACNMAKHHETVIGKLVCEIPCKEGTNEPDFSKKINY